MVANAHDVIEQLRLFELPFIHQGANGIACIHNAQRAFVMAQHRHMNQAVLVHQGEHVLQQVCGLAADE